MDDLVTNAIYLVTLDRTALQGQATKKVQMFVPENILVHCIDLNTMM